MLISNLSSCTSLLFPSSSAAKYFAIQLLKDMNVDDACSDDETGNDEDLTGDDT